MGYQKIAVSPLAGALGAEVGGVDLSQQLDNQTFSEIHQAFLDHSVLVFRDQHLSIEQHLALGRRWGTLNVHEYVDALEGHPEIIVVRKEAADKDNFGGAWHSDVTYLEAPALGSLLYAKEVPAAGGDTLFASQYRAFETLSPAMRSMLESLKAVHSAGRIYGPVEKSNFYTSGDKGMAFRRHENARKEVVHPVVRTHPETGRKALYVNAAFTVRFDGWTEVESQPLLRFLYDHAVRPEFTCRVRWAPDTLTFWDNRAVQHFAINDYPGQRRLLHRVTVDGDRPF